jgi:hypothetical protein
MAKQKLWYGFLEAGNKSSPVVIDHNMDTGEKNTVFIYNHNKQEILKYVRELVEPKLRELTAKEKELESLMKKGFSESLKTIKYKVAKSLDVPAKEAPAPEVKKTLEEPEEEFSEVGDDDWDDDDD